MRKLLQYVKGQNGKRVGVMVALPMGDRVLIGCSRCNKKDSFSKDIGTAIAEGRALYCFDKEPKIPQSMRDDMTGFVHRAVSYFADKELPPWIGQFALGGGGTV